MLQLKKYTDLELISRYKESGENSFIGELFNRYVHLVFGVCMKYLKDKDDSKDAVMQIFEKLLVDLKKHEVSNFKAWLYKVATNHCLMHLRFEQTRQEKHEELKKDYHFVMESDHDLYLDNENSNEIILNHLDEAIKDLCDEQKVCIELFYLKERSYQEVSKITGYTMNQVKSFIQNGKRNLKNYILNKNEK